MKTISKHPIKSGLVAFGVVGTIATITTFLTLSKHGKLPENGDNGFGTYLSNLTPKEQFWFAAGILLFLITSSFILGLALYYRPQDKYIQLLETKNYSITDVIIDGVSQLNSKKTLNLKTILNSIDEGAETNFVACYKHSLLSNAQLPFLVTRTGSKFEVQLPLSGKDSVPVYDKTTTPHITYDNVDDLVSQIEARNLTGPSSAVTNSDLKSKEEKSKTD